MDKKTHKKITIDYFKNAAHTKEGYYDATHPSKLKHTIWQNRVRLFIQNEIVSLSNTHKTIADIGCGNGDFTRKMARMLPECSLNGYDFSLEMIRVANRKKGAVENLSYNFLDISDNNGPTKKFDLILCLNMFHHLHPDDIDKGIETLSLMAEKTILLEIKNAGNFWNKRFRPKGEFPFTLISTEDVSAAFEKHNFAIRHVWSIFRFQWLSPILVVKLTKNNSPQEKRRQPNLDRNEQGKTMGVSNNEAFRDI